MPDGIKEYLESRIAINLWSFKQFSKNIGNGTGAADKIQKVVCVGQMKVYRVSYVVVYFCHMGQKGDVLKQLKKLSEV